MIPPRVQDAEWLRGYVRFSAPHPEIAERLLTIADHLDPPADLAALVDENGLLLDVTATPVTSVRYGTRDDDDERALASVFGSDDDRAVDYENDAWETNA